MAYCMPQPLVSGSYEARSSLDHDLGELKRHGELFGGCVRKKSACFFFLFFSFLFFSIIIIIIIILFHKPVCIIR